MRSSLYEISALVRTTLRMDCLRWYMFHPREAMMPAVQITTSVHKYFLRFADPEFVISLPFGWRTQDNKMTRSNYV